MSMSNYHFVPPYSYSIRFKRMIWNVLWFFVSALLPRKSGNNIKIALLRIFGAQIHSSSIVYSGVKIFMPWNLIIGKNSCIANDVIIENAASIIVGNNVIISQYSYLCTASHDIRKISFPQYSKSIHLDDSSWIGASSFIGPGVTIGKFAVVGAFSGVFKNVEENNVVGGNPCKIINYRSFDE